MFSASNLCLYQIVSVINSHSIQCEHIVCFSLATFNYRIHPYTFLKFKIVYFLFNFFGGKLLQQLLRASSDKHHLVKRETIIYVLS